MSLKLSIVSPVLDEVDFIGYSIMGALPHVHEFVYAIDSKSSDGTRDLLHHIKEKYAHEKLVILEHPNFNVHDMAAYNEAFNRCIRTSTGDAVGFIHPDMLITKWHDLERGPLAWWVNMTSYAGDMKTIISSGRCSKWKNIHMKSFGVNYYGGYGSVNEDFYHKEITGNAYRHYGTEFEKYPFAVEDSGISVNHYCEVKAYKRRLEKMKFCLKTQNPLFTDLHINDLALHHPRVTLENTDKRFGNFEFKPSEIPAPEVFSKYKEEFDAFKRSPALV